MEKKKKINTMQNNLFAVSLCWKICKPQVIHRAISRFLYYVGWLFYSAFFMRYVINALQEGKTFAAIMIFVGRTVGLFAAMALYNSYILGYVAPTADAQINKKLYQMLFKKSRNVELECFENSDFYDKYTLAMARRRDPDSAASQFYITLEATHNLDPNPNTAQPNGYAPFGKVLEGFEVVDKIGAKPVTTKNMYQGVPVENVKIIKMSVIAKPQPKEEKK